MDCGGHHVSIWAGSEGRQTSRPKALVTRNLDSSNVSLKGQNSSSLLCQIAKQTNSTGIGRVFSTWSKLSSL